MKEEFIDEFSQLPSKTGKDVIYLEEYAKLPRTKTYKEVESFLEAARKSKEVKLLFIVAEWGEGKTSIYESLLKKPEIVKQDVVIPIPTRRLLSILSSQEFSDVNSLGIRFFVALLYAIKDEIENYLVNASPFDKIKIPAKRAEERTMDFILRGLRSIFNALSVNCRLIVFLDEFEDILDEQTTLQHFVIGGLVEVINGYPRCLCEGDYAGRFHIIVAVTPPAYHRISTLTLTDAGRLFGQRAQVVELEKLDRKHAYNFILGVLKYMWNGRLPTLPFSNVGMFNAIFLATMGNPRTIINVIEKLITQAKSFAPVGKIKIIKPHDFISILSGGKFRIYGGDVTILDKASLDVFYNEIEKICREYKVDASKCLSFAEMLLALPIPLSKREIMKELNLEEEEYRDCLNVIGDSFEKIWGIWPYIHFRKVIKGQDAIKKTEKLSKIISALEFYDYDYEKQAFVDSLFVPFKALGKMREENERIFRSFIDYFTSFAPELSDEGELRVLVDREIFDKTEKSDEEYLMLSPTALNIFYPSPAVFFLDFIEDVNKRFEIGMELMRNLSSYEQQFSEGIRALLRDGVSENMVVKRETKSYEFEEIELINLTCEMGNLRYELKSYVYSPLKLPPLASANEELSKIKEKMERAHIPFLLIFSWNPLPLEIKSILETLFGAEKSRDERVFYYLDFPLTTLHCHQIIGYALAKRKNYQIKEEKWKARATRILGELKFAEYLIQFIQKGVEKGYTTRQLFLKNLKLDEVTSVLRTLLITDGTLTERYKQLLELRDKFKIYGRSFALSPKDFETEDDLKRFIEDLLRNKLIEETAECGYKTDLTPHEKRIIAILELYKKPLQKREINEFFIRTRYDMNIFDVDVYLRMLMERKRINFDKDAGYYLIGSKQLEEMFLKLKKSLDDLCNKYENYPYGYIISIKERESNSIIMKEAIDLTKRLADSIESFRYIPEEGEKRIKKQILFELLVKALTELDEIIEGFVKNLRTNYEVNLTAEKRAIDDLEKRINFLGVFPEAIRIKEKLRIEEKERKIRELLDKKFDKKEIKELGNEMKDKVIYYQGLYQEFRGCPVFDVKIVKLAEEYKDLKRIVDDCKKLLHDINETIDKIRECQEYVDNHEIFTLNYPFEAAPISAHILNWVKRNVRVHVNGEPGNSHA